MHDGRGKLPPLCLLGTQDTVARETAASDVLQRHATMECWFVGDPSSHLELFKYMSPQL